MSSKQENETAREHALRRSADRAPTEPRLFYSRAQTRARLGNCGLSTLKRMEERGVLTPYRLTGAANGKVHYSAAEVDGLADRGGDA